MKTVNEIIASENFRKLNPKEVKQFTEEYLVRLRQEPDFKDANEQDWQNLSSEIKDIFLGAYGYSKAEQLLKGPKVPPARQFEKEQKRTAFEKSMEKVPENIAGTAGAIGISVLGYPAAAPLASGFAGGTARFLQELYNAHQRNEPIDWGEVFYQAQQANKEQALLQGIGDIVAPVIRFGLKPVGKIGQKLLGKTKVGQRIFGRPPSPDIIWNKIMPTEERIYPLSKISRFAPETIPEAAVLQNLMEKTAPEVLPPNLAKRATLTIGQVSKSRWPAKAEAAATLGLGSKKLNVLHTDIQIPVYKQTLKNTIDQMAGNIRSMTELGETIHNVAQGKFKDLTKTQTNKLYEVFRTTVKNKVGDKPIVNITSFTDEGIRDAAKGRFFGGLGAKGTGDTAAGKIAKVAEPEKVKVKGIASQDLLEFAENSAELRQVLEDAGVGRQQRIISIDQADELRKRIVKEYEDAVAAFPGEKETLKAQSAKYISMLDTAMEKAAIENGLPEAIPQIQRARKFFAAANARYDKDIVQKIWKLGEENPEKLMDYIVSKNGITTLRDVKKVLGEEATPIIADVKKTMLNDILNDPTRQFDDYIFNRKYPDPQAVEKAFYNRFGDELVKELYSPEELKNLNTMLRLGKVVLAHSPIGNVGAYVIPAGQISAGVAIGASALQGKATRRLSSIGLTLTLGPKAISEVATNRNLVNRIIDIQRMTGFEDIVKRSEMIRELFEALISNPAIATDVRLINMANQ